MSQSGGKSEGVELARVGVQRLGADHLVLSDPFLKGCPVVKALGVEAAAALLKKGTARRFADQAKIFTSVEPHRSVFLVVKGVVRLFTDGGAELRALQPGELFGERGSAQTRGCSAVADGGADVVELPGDEVELAAQHSPALTALLDEGRQRREQASAELDDFLNRW